MSISMVFKVLGLPKLVAWEDTGATAKTKVTTLLAIEKAPKVGGKLVVSGIS